MSIFAVLVGEPLPAAFLEPTVELLQVVLCQLVQRDVPNLRNDMQTDAALVGLLRGGADLWLGVIYQYVSQSPKGISGRTFSGFSPPHSALSFWSFSTHSFFVLARTFFVLG